MPSIDAPLPNGGPRNRGGFGGAVAAVAREGADDAIRRCRQVLDAGSPLTAAAAIDASEVLLMAGADERTGLLAADRAAVVSRLRSLAVDPRTPDHLAVRACRLLLERTGRRAYKGGN